MKYREDQIQSAIVKYFRLASPKSIIFACPNGGQRSKLTANIMKATGTMAGVSDLIILHKGECIFMEVKTLKGVQSEYQKEFQKRVEEQGFKYLIVKSVDEVLNNLNFK